MSRIFTRIALIIIFLTAASLACVTGGDNTSLSFSGNSDSNSGPAATATYGAEQFQLQLTAIAQPGP